MKLFNVNLFERYMLYFLWKPTGAVGVDLAGELLHDRCCFRCSEIAVINAMDSFSPVQWLGLSKISRDLPRLVPLFFLGGMAVSMFGPSFSNAVEYKSFNNQLTTVFPHMDLRDFFSGSLVVPVTSTHALDEAPEFRELPIAPIGYPAGELGRPSRRRCAVEDMNDLHYLSKVSAYERA
jgi:hypothetical protein